MSNKMQVARTVAEHLFATEDAIDAAIACAAGLVGYMPVARKAVRASVAVGQPAFQQVIASMATLAEARRQMVDAHAAFADAGQRVNLPAVNFGGLVDKPRYHDQAHLRVVEEDRAA